MRCLVVATLLCAATFALVLGGASAATGAPGPHSLTVVVEFPDPGLANAEQMCLTLFAEGDAALAHPLQTRCLTSHAIGVTFENLPSAAYRIVVPGTGSAIQDGRYEGQIVSTEIPAEPAVSDYVVQVQLALATPQPTATGTQLAIQAFVCPVATAGGSTRAAWAAVCPGRGDGITFSVTDGQGNPAGSVVTGQDGAAPGTALIRDLPPGRYQLTEGLPDNVEPAPVWFAAVEPGGEGVLIGGDGTLDLRQGERVTVWVYNVLRGIGSAPVPVLPNPGPRPSPSANSTASAVPAATPAVVLARRLPAAGSGSTSGGWSVVGIGLLVVVAAALVLAARLRGRPLR